MQIKNDDLGLYGKLNYEEREKLSMNAKWDRRVSEFVSSGVVQLVNEVVQVLSSNEEMREDMAVFDAPDYEEAVLNSDFLVVKTASEQFHYFNTKDFSTIEVDQDNGDCVIDFKAFAKDHGIDLNDWRFDVHAMSVVPANEASPSTTPENDVIAGFVHHSAYVPSMMDGEINGKDIVNSVIVPIFNEAGKAEVAQQLIDDPWKVLGITENGEHRYLNREFDAVSQTFDSYEDICESICNDHGLDAKSPEIFQYFLVKGWFSELLKEEGMRVAEVAGLTVWGRESFGMAISMEPYAQRMFAKDCTNASDDLIRKILPEVEQRLVAEQEKRAPALDAGLALG